MLRKKRIVKKLKLPIIKQALPEPSPLNMDDYLKFMMFNLKYCPPMELSKEEEIRMRVNVPFVKK